MKSKTTFIASFLLVVQTVHAQRIQFDQHSSWEQIVQKAKSQNKFIFMDAYATWCIPCKKMAAETFSEKVAGDYFNKKFVAVKVQMDQTASDDESIKKWYTQAKTMVEKYKITAYPTVMFFSPSGEIIGRAVGYRNAAGLIADAEQAIGMSITFDSLYAKYRKNKQDSAVAMNLSRTARSMGRTDVEQKIAQDYINSLKGRALFDKNNLIFISHFTVSSKNRGFDLFRGYRKRINNILGDNAVEFLVRGVITQEEIVPYVTQGKFPNWQEIERRLNKKYNDTLAAEALAGEQMAYSLEKEDWVSYCKYYKLYYSTAYTRSKFHINNASWALFEHATDSAILRVAIRAMKYNLHKYDMNDPNAMDTYANLLYKIGNRMGAIQWEEKALQFSNNRKDLAETLEKMKRGEKTWKE